MSRGGAFKKVVENAEGGVIESIRGAILLSRHEMGGEFEPPSRQVREENCG